MPIIVGTEDDVKQYAQSTARREKLNNLGLGLFIIGMVLFGLTSAAILPSGWMSNISILLSIVGFILAYFTKFERNSLHTLGLFLLAGAVVIYILVFTLSLSFGPMAVAITLFLMGIGLVITT
jgi:hypothetical protein